MASLGSLGAHPGELNSPSGIAVDPQGFVYVADTGNNRIQKFNANGRLNKSIGSFGDGPGQFDSPHGIAVDPHGVIYVADMNNHRLQKFGANGTYITQWGQFAEGRTITLLILGRIISVSKTTLLFFTS